MNCASAGWWRFGVAVFICALVLPAALAGAAAGPVVTGRQASGVQSTPPSTFQSIPGALEPSFDPSNAVENGGDGPLTVRVSQVVARAVTVRGLRLTVTSTRVARVLVGGSNGWRCSADRVRSRVGCTLAGMRSSSSVPPLTLTLDDGANGVYGSGAVTALLAWRQRSNTRLISMQDRHRLGIQALRPLAVRLTRSTRGSATESPVSPPSRSCWPAR